MVTHQLNYATHQLENLHLPSEDTALNFQYWNVLFLQHPLPWTELELPAGLSLSTQGMDNPAVTGDTCSGLHLHFRLAFCKSGPKPLGLQIVVKASGDVFQIETFQY